MTKKTQKKLNVFTRMHRVFENNISMLDVSIEIIGSYASKYDKSELDKFLKLIEPKLKEAKRKKHLVFTDSEAEELLKVRTRQPRQGELFKRNTLVSTVSTVDTLFAKIFEYYYSRFPEELSIDNQKITYNELREIKKIEEAREFLISREVELLLLQKGLRERLKILSDKLKISFSGEDTLIKEFKKLIKIRNLIVHNEGRADSEFAEEYNEENIKKGEKIKISEKYLKKSLALVYFVGSYVLQMLQSKLEETLVPADEFILNNTLHNLLKKESYEFNRMIYDYAIKNEIDEVNRKMIVINYCIGIKRQGKEVEHIDKVLDKEDWTVITPDFEMAIECLKGNDDKFYKILGELIKSKKVGKWELENWELFSAHKKKPKFKAIKLKSSKK
jgi:hypothetical protein